jgi:hypothetical protein
MGSMNPIRVGRRDARPRRESMNLSSACHDAVLVEQGLEGGVEAGDRLGGGEPCHDERGLDAADRRAAVLAGARSHCEPYESGTAGSACGRRRSDE